MKSKSQRQRAKTIGQLIMMIYVCAGKAAPAAMSLDLSDSSRLVGSGASDHDELTPYDPTGVTDHSFTQNCDRADGIAITPSHNPPEDGGFKYNPANDGPADADAIQIVSAELRCDAGRVALANCMEREQSLLAVTLIVLN